MLSEACDFLGYFRETTQICNDLIYNIVCASENRDLRIQVYNTLRKLILNKINENNFPLKTEESEIQDYVISPSSNKNMGNGTPNKNLQNSSFFSGELYSKE